eukprot:gene2001-5077_t
MYVDDNELAPTESLIGWTKPASSLLFELLVSRVEDEGDMYMDVAESALCSVFYVTLNVGLVLAVSPCGVRGVEHHIEVLQGSQGMVG